MPTTEQYELPGYDRAAHWIAAERATNEYFDQRSCGASEDHANARALNTYLDTYEQAAGQPFPEELLDSTEWPGIWDEPRSEADLQMARESRERTEQMEAEQFAFSTRFRLVSTRYPRRVAEAYERDLRKALADSEEQVAATVAAWEERTGLPVQDWYAIGREERDEGPEEARS